MMMIFFFFFFFFFFFSNFGIIILVSAGVDVVGLGLDEKVKQWFNFFTTLIQKMIYFLRD